MKKTHKLSSPAVSDSWQAEDDMRTLARAEEIRRDPKRLAAAKTVAKQKLEEIAVVAATKSTE